jgi:hypothetical protein
MSLKIRSRVGMLVAALLGALLAGQVFARHAEADCVEHTWRVDLISATASDGSTAHQAYWPIKGDLHAWQDNVLNTGHAAISFPEAPAGAIQQVRADR